MLNPHEITYEHPLNERARTLLRLEYLFRQTEYHLQLPEVWESRAAVEGVLGMAALSARHDLKSELIKELDRQHGVLRQMSALPGIDPERLGEVLKELKTTGEELYATAGQLGQALRKDELLKTVQQRIMIPGGTCPFDLPLFHYWLQRPADERRQDLETWVGALLPVRKATHLLLGMIRNSASPTRELAPEGYYQRVLDNQQTPQMLRITLPMEPALLPEVSGIRNRFAIRFLAYSQDSRPQQTTDNVAFQLCLCAL
jgi:cell division protein ZapD